MKYLIFVICVFYIGIGYLFAGSETEFLLVDNPNNDNSKPITIRPIGFDAKLKIEIRLDDEVNSPQQLINKVIYHPQSLSIKVFNNNTESQTENNPFVITFEIENALHSVSFGSNKSYSFIEPDFKNTGFSLTIKTINNI